MHVHAVVDIFSKASNSLAPKWAPCAPDASAMPPASQPVEPARQGTKRMHEEDALQPVPQLPKKYGLWWAKGHYWWPVEEMAFHVKKQTRCWPKPCQVYEWYKLRAEEGTLPASAPHVDEFIAHVDWMVKTVETLTAQGDPRARMLDVYTYQPVHYVFPPGLYAGNPEDCANLQAPHAYHEAPGSSSQLQAASAAGINRAGARPPVSGGAGPAARVPAPAATPSPSFTAHGQGSGWGAAAATDALLHADGGAKGQFAAHLPYRPMAQAPASAPVPQVELPAQQPATKRRKIARTSAGLGTSVAKPSPAPLPSGGSSRAPPPPPAAVRMAAPQRRPLSPTQPGNACSFSGRSHAGQPPRCGGGQVQHAGHPGQHGHGQVHYGEQQRQHAGQPTQHGGVHMQSGGQHVSHGRAAAARVQAPPAAAPVASAAPRQPLGLGVTPAIYGPFFCGSDDAAGELTGSLREQLIADMAEETRGPRVEAPAQQAAQQPARAPADLPLGLSTNCDDVFVPFPGAGSLTVGWLGVLPFA